MALTQVKTSGIADDAVTQDKVANDAIDITELKARTDGHILTYDASGNPTSVGPGTDGQVLTSTGAGSPPAFETLPASNNYTHPNHSGEVTSTADGAQVIADDVVDEANLKVSNAPTNGYALTAQSGNTGGLTWAEIAGGLDGVTTGRGNVTISDGDLIIGTAGHGIDFSATSNHGDSIGTEILSDYETGKWTATLGNDGTFSATDANCTYVKIGHAVFFGGVVSVPSGLSWTGGTEISGIPFTHTATSGWHTANFCVLKQTNWDSNDRGFPTMWVNTSDKIGFSDSTSGNQGGTFRINTSTGHYFYFGGWYMTDQD